MDKKTLIKYILGRGSKSDKRAIAAWLQESPENVEEFAKLKAQYVFSALPNTVLPEKRKARPVITAIAAALAVPVLVAAIYFFIANQKATENYMAATEKIELLMSQNPGAVTYIANPGIKSTVILPDSSVVRLNGDSKLIAPTLFTADVRELYLSGEGYFEVRHHENWPMHIRTAKGVTVKVLGTTFDLSAYENDSMVKLTLIEGKVLMHEDKTNFEHEIKPLQEINIPTEKAMEKTVIKTANVEKNTSWTKGELIFDNTPMPEIVKQLERWYGVKIHISDNSILNYRLTATFTNESITRVLELIRFSSMINYDIRGTDVYINDTPTQSAI